MNAPPVDKYTRRYKTNTARMDEVTRQLEPEERTVLWRWIVISICDVIYLDLRHLRKRVFISR